MMKSTYPSFKKYVYPFNSRIFLSVELVDCWSHSVVVQNVQGFVTKVMIASEYNSSFLSYYYKLFKFILLS